MNTFKTLSLVAPLLLGFPIAAQAGSENCQNKSLKSLAEVTSLLADSGDGQVYVLESGYSPGTLTFVTKDEDGRLQKRLFSPSALTEKSTAWKRLPDFDYDDMPATFNTSCGRGPINYKLAFQVGDSAICYLHNPKGSVLDRKGKLVACLVVTNGVQTLIEKVRIDLASKSE